METKRSGPPRIKLDEYAGRQTSLTHFAIGYGVMVNIVDSHLSGVIASQQLRVRFPVSEKHLMVTIFFIFLGGYFLVTFFVSLLFLLVIFREHPLWDPVNYSSVYHLVDSKYLLLHFFCHQQQAGPHRMKRGAMQIPNHTEGAAAPPGCYGGFPLPNDRETGHGSIIAAWLGSAIHRRALIAPLSFSLRVQFLGDCRPTNSEADTAQKKAYLTRSMQLQRLFLRRRCHKCAIRH